MKKVLAIHGVGACQKPPFSLILRRFVRLDCYVISLRDFVPDIPVRLIVLEPWVLAPIASSWPLDASPDIVIVTSPYAGFLLVGAADIFTRAKFYAPGRGTAASLHTVGVDFVMTPEDETSDGLMALPGLQDVAGLTVLVLGAAGGRGIIQARLAERGASVIDHHVYTRTKITPSLSEWYAVRDMQHGTLLVSSLNALQALDEGLSPPDQRYLRELEVIASSERIAQAAREMGFAEVVLAGTPQPNEMLRVTRFS